MTFVIEWLVVFSASMLANAVFVFIYGKLSEREKQ